MFSRNEAGCFFTFVALFNQSLSICPSTTLLLKEISQQLTDGLQLNLIYTNQPQHVNHWQVSTIDHHIKMQCSDGKPWVAPSIQTLSGYYMDPGHPLMATNWISCISQQFCLPQSKKLGFLKLNTQGNITS